MTNADTNNPDPMLGGDTVEFGGSDFAGDFGQFDDPGGNTVEFDDGFYAAPRSAQPGYGQQAPWPDAPPGYGPVVGPGPRQPSVEQPPGAVHNPLDPSYHDPWYDADEWDTLPRRMPKIIRPAIILGVVFVIGLFSFRSGTAWLDDRLDPPGPPGRSIEVAIPSGATSDDIARILAQEDVVASSFVTSYYWRFNEAPSFQAGDYIFQTAMSVDEAREVLEGGPLPTEFDGERVLIPEGLWLEDIEDRLLDELPEFDPFELAVALRDGQIRSQFQPEGSDNLEGLIFPATYEVPKEEAGNELAMVQRMVNTFDQRARGVELDLAPEKVNLTPYEAVIVASLIEEEAKVDEERPMIARVIYNRLRDGDLLQIDATVIKALGEYPEDGVVLLSDLEVDNPFNTYVYPGLPPTPLSSPGEASLRAALNPADGEWKFYVVIDEDGRHAFAETFAEHEANIAAAAAAGVR